MGVLLFLSLGELVAIPEAGRLPGTLGLRDVGGALSDGFVPESVVLVWTCIEGAGTEGLERFSEVR